MQLWWIRKKSFFSHRGHWGLREIPYFPRR